MTTTCPRPADGPCPHCTAEPGDECPLTGLDPTLLDASRSVAVAPGTAGTCDLEAGVCEACQ